MYPRYAVKRAIAGAGGSVKKLEESSEKLELIRNKTFVHIDKRGVSDPESIYKKAGITDNDVDGAIRVLWESAKTVYQATFGKPFQYTAYTGDEMGGLERLRDATPAS
jgi:AbiU2